MSSQSSANDLPSTDWVRPLAVAVLIAWCACPTLPAFAQSGGDYVIKKSTIDGGGVGTATGGDYVMGGTAGQPDANDLSGGDYFLNGGFWSPAASATGSNSPTAPPAPHDRPKNRYLSFTPNNGANPVAFKLTRLSPGPAVDVGWVGTPDAGGISYLEVSPVTRTWNEPVIHAGDCAVHPVADYEIRATADGVSFSVPLLIATIAQPAPKFWGDTVGGFVAGAWEAPNGVVNANDFVAALQGFQVLASAPHVSVTDVQRGSASDPCLNRSTNFADVFLLIKAFQGEPYPFTTDPAMCPVCP